jgi:hypothetical protein
MAVQLSYQQVCPAWWSNWCAEVENGGALPKLEKEAKRIEVKKVHEFWWALRATGATVFGCFIY